MQKVMIFILLVCTVLSLYAFCFSFGESSSFQGVYEHATGFIKTTAGAFASVKDTVTTGIQIALALPEKISSFFGNFFEKIGESLSNLAERIRQFFVGTLNRIAKLFKIETTCDCKDPENCKDCKCEAEDCPCSVGGTRGGR